jgi:hypothetical protein
VPYYRVGKRLEAWELVGGWNTGIFSSVALLIGHKSMMGDTHDPALSEGPDPGPVDPRA